MNIVAGIVLYNPDIKRLKENLDAICGQVNHVLCIDNHSYNICDIESMLKEYNNVSLLINSDNLGVAAALNKLFKYAEYNNYDWALTLDQDTVCEEGLVDEYSKYISEPKIGMMTCIIVDRNARNDELGDMQQDRIIEVEHCITSGAFCSVAAYNHTSGFDERLFIDWVDYDYSASLRAAGYRICRIPFIGMLHEIGRSESKKVFGRKTTVLNESPLRVYYRSRNKIVVGKKYPQYYSSSRITKSIIKDFIGILLYEKDKYRKIKAGIKGVVDSKKIR